MNTEGVNRAFKRLLIFLAIAVLSGCGLFSKDPAPTPSYTNYPPPVPGPTAAPEPEPGVTLVVVDVGAEANPDSSGRASPVFLKFYLLENKERFLSAQYEDIFSNREFPDGELIKEYILSPTEIERFEFVPEPEYRYLGVAAAFNDFYNAKWLEVIPVDRSKDAIYRMIVGKLSLTFFY